MYMCVLGINFVYFYDLFDQILNVLRQYGILSISMICLIRFWKFSDIMVFCLFLWSVWSDFECSQTVWYFVYFYDLFDQILNVLRQYDILSISMICLIRFWMFSDSMVFCVFYFIYIYYSWERTFLVIWIMCHVDYLVIKCYHVNSTNV